MRWKWADKWSQFHNGVLSLRFVITRIVTTKTHPNYSYTVIGNVTRSIDTAFVAVPLKWHDTHIVKILTASENSDRDPWKFWSCRDRSCRSPVPCYFTWPLPEHHFQTGSEPDQVYSGTVTRAKAKPEHLPKSTSPYSAKSRNSFFKKQKSNYIWIYNLPSYPPPIINLGN